MSFGEIEVRKYGIIYVLHILIASLIVNMKVSNRNVMRNY